jgi:hypothetical protein
MTLYARCQLRPARNEVWRLAVDETRSRDPQPQFHAHGQDGELSGAQPGASSSPVTLSSRARQSPRNNRPISSLMRYRASSERTNAARGTLIIVLPNLPYSAYPELTVGARSAPLTSSLMQPQASPRLTLSLSL